MKKTLLILFVAMTLFAGLARSAGNMFEGEGAAKIEGPDIVPARRQALDTAMKRAVEEAAGSLLPVKVFVEKYQILDTRILKNAKAYVENYNVIMETRDGEDYRLSIQANIKLDLLKKDLVAAGLLLPDEKIPRWIVIAPDRDGDGQWRTRWFAGHGGMSATEAAADDLIREYGYRLSLPDPRGAGLAEARLKEYLAFADAVDETTTEIPKELLLDAANAGATFILLGKGQANSAEGLTGDEYYLGTASVKLALIDVAAAKVIGVVGLKAAVETVGKTGLDARVLRMALGRGRDELYKKFDSVNPYGEQAGFAVVTVRFIGVTAFDHFLLIRKSLEKNVRGVRSVSIMKLKPGEATVQIRYAGDGYKMVQELLAQTFDQFTLKDGGIQDGIYNIEIK